MTQHDVDEAAWNDAANWHGGLLGLYYSKRDSRAFVPKRRGIGVTVNFARRSGVVVLIGFALFVILMIVLTRPH